MTQQKNLHPSTLCAHLARGDRSQACFVNPPSTRGSTYLYPDVASFRDAYAREKQPGDVSYGRHGSQTTRELEQALATLDGAYAAMVLSSGYSAICIAILACVSTGDHILMVDTIYEPARKFATQTLHRLGIETTFYPADASSDLAALIQPNTKLIFLESPGSLTMEIQDLDALITLAKAHNVLTILDNTWATSIYYPAISKGINISVQAATKYISGHSDLMMGVITTDEANWSRVRKTYIEFGQSPGTEETMLALRGLRTLPCRLKQHGKSAIRIARWLEKQALVHKVYFPALQSSPDYALFQRQYRATSGLFSFSLKTDNQRAVAKMIDGMGFFAIGVSWGGYESLMIPTDPRKIRTSQPWTDKNQLIRVNIGLEHANDLIADLRAGFKRLQSAL